MRFLVKGESPHTVDNILQMGGNGEIPDGSGNDNAVCLSNMLMEEGKIIVIGTMRSVAFHGKVLYVEILEGESVKGDIRYLANTFQEGLCKCCAITGNIGTSDNEKNASLHVGIVCMGRGAMESGTAFLLYKEGRVVS